VHNRGRLLRAAAAALVVLALAGCAASGNTVDPSAGAAIGRQALGSLTSTPTASPDAGQCWQLSYLQFLQQPEGPGGKQVPCSGPHQAITFATLTPALGVQRIDAAAPADRACSDAYNALLPDSIEAYRLLVAATLPSAADWAGGKRSVQCEIQETAVGSLYRDPTFADLPATIAPIVSTYQTSPEDFHMCINEPGSSGQSGPGLGDAAVIADCSTGQWRLRPSPDFPDPAGEAYPGYNGLYPFMHSHCGALYDTATIRGWIFYPSATDWAQGVRFFQCWTGTR
jgi:hypothetical protein